MSTIKADTFVDLSREAAGTTPNSIGTEYLVEGTAKAWCKFDGTGTIAIDDDFNASSLTDTTTGQYVVNLAVTLDNSQHCSVGSSGAYHTFNRTSSATAAHIYTLNVSHSAVDEAELFVASFGDLA